MSGLIHSNRDVLAFCQSRLDPEFTSEIIKKNRQGVETPSLEAHLNRGNYVPVLADLMLKDPEVLPDLTWVGCHGMLPEGVVPEMVPSNQFADIRKQFIFDNLSLISI